MRCHVCHAEPEVFVLGGEEGSPIESWCLACAKLAGFPWVTSEAGAMRRLAREARAALSVKGG